MQQTALNVKSAVTFTKCYFFIGYRQGYQFLFCFLLKDAVDDDDERKLTLYIKLAVYFPDLCYRKELLISK